MRRRAAVAAIVTALAVLLVALALAPGAAAHEGEDHDGSSSGGSTGAGHGNGSRPPRSVVPVKRGYEVFLGEHFWGSVSSVPNPDHVPSDPAISPGWVVWVAENGSRTDIHAYNLSKGIRVEVTDDEAEQRAPAIDGSQVVWRESDDSGYRLQLYNLEAGRSKVLTRSPDILKNPTISGRWVVWQDFRSRSEASEASSWDLFAYDLKKDRELPVATGSSTDTDPAVVGDHVAWRHRQYGQVDIKVQNLTTGRTARVTANVNLEVNLRAGNASFVYFQRHRTRPGYHGYRYYPGAARTVNLGFDAPSSTGALPADGAVVIQRPFIENETLAIRPTEEDSATTLHTGRLDYRSVTPPANQTIAAVVGTPEGRTLITYQYSHLADDPTPEVTITEPKTTDVVGNETTVKGRVDFQGPWPPPTRVFVTLDDAQGWVLASGTTEWTAKLDLSDVNPGRHTLIAAAEFPEGPTWSTEVRIAVGAPMDFTQNLSGFGAETKGLIAAILGTLPLLVVLALTLLAVLLLAARTYLRWLRERYPDARYVAPDEPGPPHDNPAEAAGEPDEAQDAGAGS